MRQMSVLSITFTSLIAEALLLPPTEFDRFFDHDQQHKLKIVKYPDTASLPSTSSGSRNTTNESAPAQGVGPHKDSMLTSYLLQASPHRGLQAQNFAGAWIDCPPIPGTLVVAIGQGLEALTRGVCASTTHRVLSPSSGSGARFSVPFFQGVSYDAVFESVDIPAPILAMRDAVRQDQGDMSGRRDDVEFTFKKGRWSHMGEATFYNRVKSHPDVGERWYPDILARIRAEQKAAGIEAVQARDEAKREGENVQSIHATATAQGPAIQAR